MAFSKLSVHPLVTLPVLLFLSCNCTVLNPSQEKSNETPSPAVSEARVQKALQDEVFANAESKSNWQDLYALFSQSSYVDRGQIWVYRSESGSEVVALKPGLRSLSEAVTLRSAATDIQALYDFLDANSSLADFDAASFDGVQFEFVHIKKKAEGHSLVKRVFMNNPPEAGKHTELIQAFQNLIP